MRTAQVGDHDIQLQSVCYEPERFTSALRGDRYLSKRRQPIVREDQRGVFRRMAASRPFTSPLVGDALAAGDPAFHFSRITVPRITAMVRSTSSHICMEA
jgi:hypothetical protein